MKKIFLLAIVIIASNYSFGQYFQDTKGELSISDAGTANYSVPIAMPPSINNSAPQINLTYSSGVKGGIAGQGWNISSISSITRIATRRDIDGYVDGVDFDDNDKLALDGQRLILKSGNYWQNNSTYETEYKSNTKIELKIEGGHIYFIVTSPDGSRTWYGSTGNGVIQNATSLNAWYIVRHEDVYGNYITYVYNNVIYNNSGQQYIDSILFSGNEAQGIVQINKIKFNYLNANRIERDFIKGLPSYATKILDNVEVFTDNVLFRKYELHRFPPDESGYERVEYIQEFNGSLEPSNPIYFSYYSTPLTTTRTEKEYYNNLAFNQIDLAGDFDGDGRLDFTVSNQFYNNVFEDTVPGFPIIMPFTTPNFAITTLSLDNKLNQFQSLLKINKLNNSTTEFKVYEYNNGTIQHSFTKSINLDLNVTVTANNATGTVLGIQCWNYLNANLSSFAPNATATFKEGDFNGNGISEILIIKPVTSYTVTNNHVYDPDNRPFNPNNCSFTTTSNGSPSYYVVELTPNSSTSLGNPGFISVSDAYNSLSNIVQIADFTGDGRADILSVVNGTYKVCELYTTPNYGYTILKGSGSMPEFSLTKQIQYGDYNGDGKVDLMIPNTEGGIGFDHSFWHIYYSNPNPNGGAFFTKETLFIAEYWPNSTIQNPGYFTHQAQFNNFYAIDVNKDGKSDLVKVWRKYYKPNWTINDHNTSWRVEVFTNNIGLEGASGFTNTYNSIHFISDSPDIPIPIAGNFKNSNANTDLVIVRGHFNKIEYYKFNKDYNSDNRLQSVSEVYNNVQQIIEYKPMMAESGGLGNIETDFYSSSNSVFYPNVEIIRNEEAFLVSKLTAITNGVTKYQKFRYRGYVSNFNYGNVGFIRTSRSSWYNQAVMASVFWTTKHNDVNLRGANTITWMNYSPPTVFNPVPDLLMTTKTNNFSTYTFPNKVYNVLLDSQTSFHSFTNVTTEKLYTYDGSVDALGTYGLQTSEITKTYLGTVLESTSTVTTPIEEYDNNPNGIGNAYYIGKPKKISTTTTIYPNTVNQDIRTSEEKYTYNGPNISKIEKKGHNTDYLTEEMTYDAVGNLLTKTLSMPTASPPIAERTITDEYDPTKRFVITKTDHQGFVTQLEYNSLGQLKKSTDHFGVINEFTYGNWGAISQSRTFNTATMTIMTSYYYSKFSDGSYSVTKLNIVGGNSMNRTTYDALGRIITTTTKGFESGSEISKSIEYDILGRKFRESEPYFTTASKWTVYEYDLFHRVKKITLPTNSIQTINYTGLTTTTVENGVTRSSTLNSMGNKVRTTDPGGVVEFFYYANGQLKKSKYISHEITIGIDGWGNKTSMNDPNAGLYSYTYDAFGQTKTETTPKGTTTYTYDDFGKLINKSVIGDGADFNTVYTYNTFGQLETETSKTAANIPIDNYGYTYDNYHRLIGTLENNANLEHTKTINYDPYGRVATETNYTREKSSSNFSSTVTHKMVYNTYNGILYKVTDSADVLLWQINSANEKMQTLTASLGNGVSITNSYDANYFFSSQQHTKNSTFLVNSNYVFDNVKGNLTSRQNLAPGMGISENFTYDNLDRLETWSNPVTGVQDFNAYDAKGRITDNNKVGNIRYNTNLATGIYRKSAVKLNAEGLAYYNALGGNQQISYTMFKTPISINESNRGKINFSYGSHLDRTKMLYDYGFVGGSTMKVQRKTKLYTSDGTTEVIYDNVANSIKILTFIAGDAYSAIGYNEKIKKNSTGTITDNSYYLHRDYLGSIIAISDANGVAIEKRHFDAWGNLAKIVNGANAILPLSDGLVALDRGYTSHEHLHEVRLIHMNGRLYDPVLKSFLMPDNFVQQPENSQNYNRYAYCLNNPLRYTDPSGEEAITLGVAVIIAVAVAVTSYTLTALLTDVQFSAGGLLKTATIAAASAVVTFGIGSAADSLFGAATTFTKASFQAAAHGTFQGTMTGLQGGKFWSGFASGAVSSIASSGWSADTNGAAEGLGFANGIRQSGAGMIAFGTVTGGASAKLTGGNFWQGAVSGLFVSALNHAATHNKPVSRKSLLSRFKKDTNGKYIVDPDATPNFTQEGTDSLLENVEGLNAAYEAGGSRPVDYKLAEGRKAGKTITDTVEDYERFSFSKKWNRTNYELASTMFHEFRHGWLYWGAGNQYYIKWGMKHGGSLTEICERHCYWYELSMGSNLSDTKRMYDFYKEKTNSIPSESLRVKN